MEHPSGLHDRLIAAVVALGLFAIYAAGACRTIYVGDSGELVTAVHVLGIPHPSGYPLYVLLGKLWTLLLPLGSIAFRMSLFSAACAAATCALLFVTIRQDGGSRTAGLFGALVLAFAPSFWQEANIQRVYALNAIFVVLALNRALAWYRERKPRDLVIAMLLTGLGATNHTVMALVGVTIAAWAAIIDRSLFRRPWLAASCAGAFAAGLLPYLYLLLRSRMNPVLNWGEPKTLESFFNVVMRRGFWHRAWWEGPKDLLPIVWDFVTSLGPETGFAGAVLAIILVAAGFERKWLLPIFVVVVNVAAVARHGSYLDIFVWHRYYIPAYLSLTLLGAFGLDLLLKKTGAKRLAAAVLAIPIVMMSSGWKQADRSRFTFAEDFSRHLFGVLPPGSKLLTNDDNVLFVLLYLRYVEGLRPDIELVAEGVGQRKPDLFFDPDEDHVFSTHPPTWSVEGLEFVPRGPVLQAIRSGRPWPEPLAELEVASPLEGRASGDFLVRILAAHHWFMQALTWEHRDWNHTEDALRRARSEAPDYPLSLFNLAIIWGRNGFYDEALSLLEQADAVDSRGIAGTIDPATGRGRRTLPADEGRKVVAERDRIRALEAQIQAASLAGIEPGSAFWHERLAAELARRGETAAARFHAIRADAIRR